MIQNSAASQSSTTPTANAADTATRTKVYYARSYTLRGGNTERADIDLLEALGFEVVNAERSEDEDDDYTANRQYLNRHENRNPNKLAGAVAYRPYPDGSIPDGMAKLINSARGWKIPVIELPWERTRRRLNIGETSEFLAGMGHD